MISLLIVGCNSNKKVDGVYRYYWGKRIIMIYGLLMETR